MRPDYLSYKRAFSVSLAGVGLQLAFTVVMAIYSVVSGDHAAFTAAGFMGIGVFGWICLAVLFDQHRRERMEAMEAESFSASNMNAGSVFENRGDEFRVAAKRLAGLYKFFVPSVSILMGVLLVTLAVVRFNSGLERSAPDKFFAPLHQGWSLGIDCGIAIIGFVFARYVAGLAKHPAWQNLRGGAAYAVGSALLAVTMAVGHFVDMAGPDAITRYAQVAFPIFAGIIGLETFLNFVLDLYRPRKPGDTPRPAFDSRVLGFAAAPDRIAQSISDAINYQLGFDVTSGWLYQLLSRSLGRLLAFGVVVIWLMSSVAILQPHQRGTILRFGRPVQENIGPGWHWKMPWPIDTVYIPEYFALDEKGRRNITDRTATGVRTIQLSTSPPGTKEPLLWTNDHLGEEVFQPVRSGPTSLPLENDPTGGRQSRENGGSGMSESGSLTELSLISVEIPLQYAVTNVAVFDRLAPPHLRDDLLKAVAQREATRYLQTVTIDELLGPKRSEHSAALKSRVVAAFAQLNVDPTGKPQGAGVEVLFCGITGAHPPKDKDVASSFEKVVEADQRFHARLNGAEADAIAELTKAAGGVELARAILAEIDALERLKTESAQSQAVVAQEQKVQEILNRSGGYTAAAISRAKADRWERHMGAKGRAIQYGGLLSAYNAAPSLFRASMYFDSLREAMRESRIYITSGNVANQWFTVELQDRTSGIDLFAPKKD